MGKYITDAMINSVRDDLQEEFRPTFDDPNTTVNQVFNVITVGDNMNESKYLKGKTVGGLAMPREYQIGEPVVETSIIDGYEYLIEYRLFRQAIGEFVIDARNARKTLNGLFDHSLEMGYAFASRQEVEAFDWLNNGESKLAPDGEPFFSTTHPIKDDQYNNTSNTWPNLITGRPLTHDNLDYSVSFAKTQQRRHDGDKAIWTPKILLVPQMAYNQALRVTQSDLNPDNDTNAKNILKGSYKVVEAPRLSDGTSSQTSNWYLLGDKKDHGLYFVWRIKPMIEIEEDVRSMKVTTIMTMYFGVGAKHSHGIVKVRYN